MGTSTRAESKKGWRWSFSIGHIAGIDLRVHATFLVLLAWIVISHVAAGHGPTVALQGVAFMLLVFGVVVLHELGHALTARRYGVGTKDILLLPIGGVARLERMPSEPKQELLVAIAGPMVNVVLALAAFVGLMLAGASWSPEGLSVVGGPLFAKFMWLNVVLAAFNLLPAFPMDGGRALRALLSMKLGRLRATDVAASIGQWAALLLGALGLFANPILVLIAVFVWMGASQEAAHAHIMAALDRIRVRDVMVTRFDILPAEAPIGYGVSRALHSVQHEFPVFSGEQFIGMVSASELVRAARERDSSLPIQSVARPVDVLTHPDENVDNAVTRGQRGSSNVLPVIQSGRLVGLLLSENVMQFAQLYDGRRAPVGA